MYTSYTLTIRQTHAYNRFMINLKRCTQTAVYLCLGSLAAFAVPSVGTVTSAVPFLLDGHEVSSPGVTSFPLVPGDTVAASNGPAVLLFNDGSRVKLSENSSVKLDSVGPNLKVVLLTGAVDYKLVAGSNLKVTDAIPANDQKVVDSTPSADASRKHLTSVLSNPTFIVPTTVSAVGLATALLNPSSSAATAANSSSTTTATAAAVSAPRSIVHCQPVSCHF
jgi:hypothetical protein